VRRGVLVCAVGLAVACSADPAIVRDDAPGRGRDAGMRLGGDPRDARAAATLDGGPLDGRSLDAGPLDAGLVDAGPSLVGDAVAIIDAPMAWSDARAALTLAYRRQHSDPDAADLAIEPRIIVLHYTGGGSAAATRRYFDQVRIEAARPALARAGAVNVSAHFVVDRDGTIYQLQPTDRFARHCIGLNHVAIGVENVGDDARLPLTEAQVVANAALIRALARRHPITRVVGHHEVMALRADADYVERDRGYRNTKPDPGPRFMARVRARLADLGLRGP
jgi:hypothetical protein